MLAGDTPGVGTFTFDGGTSFNLIVSRNTTSGTHHTTVDASALATMNVTGNRIDVGLLSSSGGGNGSGTLVLADDNNLTLNLIRVGGWNGTGTVRLGTTNLIQADEINLGWGIANGPNGTMSFNPSVSNPEVTIGGRNSSRANLFAGYGPAGSGTGHLNLTGGTANVMLGSVILGQPRNHVSFSGTGTGTITFDDGVIDAQTMVLGRSLAASNASGVGRGYVNVNGGTLIADTITLGDLLGNAHARGYLNIAGGTVEATTITIGSNAGTGGIVRELNFTSGVLSHKTGTDLTVSAGIDFNLLGTGSKQVFADAGRTVTINANIEDSGAGPYSGIEKTGDGTLLLNGTNTYTGETLVSAGTLGGNGSLLSTVSVGSGAMLAPGESAGTMTVDSADLQSGSTLQIELGGTTPGVGGYDQLVVTGTASLAGNLEVVLLPGFNIDNSDVFTIIDAGLIEGTFSNAVTSVGLANGIGYFDITYGAGFVQLSNFQVPEPSSLCLLGLGCVMLARRRRRK